MGRRWGRFRQHLFHLHSEGQISLRAAQEDGVRTNPLQPCVAPLPDTHIIGVSFPRPLPMDKDINIVLFDHDPFDFNLKGYGKEGFEVHLDLPPQFIQLFQRQQHRMKPGSILSLISAPQGFQRLIDTEESLVLRRVSDGL
jgi:hypothetical protein